MLLTSLLCLTAGLAAAHPHGANLSSFGRRATQLNNYRFNTVSQYTTLDELPFSARRLARQKRNEPADLIQIATSKLQEVVPKATFRVEDGFYVGSNGVGHVHFKQTIDGVDVEDANFNFNILEDGTILSYGHSFHEDVAVAAHGFARRMDELIPPLVALQNVVDLLDLPIRGIADANAETDGNIKFSYVIRGVGGTLSDPTVGLAYVRHNDSTLLTWRVESNIGSNWLHAYVDAATGKEITGVVDYNHGATYEAFPWGTFNPNEGPRRLVETPEDALGSPFGWHSDGTQDYTTLRGNNAVVSISRGGQLPVSPSLIFSYPYSPSNPDTGSYADASATQGFYTINKFHDILYVLGFDEAAGNFQASNNGKGGLGGDPVQLIVQGSTLGIISVPADGRSPQLTMGVASGGGPPRDAVFDATILLHEYMHGVTIRLVGGPSNSGCLSGMEGLSINEGYSDFVPTLLRVKESDTRDTDYTIAEWTTGTPVGLRDHYISTSLETTPLTFQDLNRLTGTGGFDLATVWVVALYEIFWNLVDVHGIGGQDEVVLGPDGVPQGARYLLLKLILDSEALMPCNANHLQARDALLDADLILTGGENRCAIWRGFATRGYGQDATRGTGTSGRINGFAVPSRC